MSDLWYEKYRPNNVEEYVWMNDNLKQKYQEWVQEGVFPNLLLHGITGSGKTSLAKMLISDIGIEKYDVLELNASKQGNAETIRDKVDRFSSKHPVSDIENARRVVILNEVQHMSQTAQNMLLDDIESREAYCRYILTCNAVNKVIPALRGRLQEYGFFALPFNDFLKRVAEILISEDVEFADEDLIAYCKNFHPNLRKCINEIQKNTDGNKLRSLDQESVNSLTYLESMANLFSKGKFVEARKLIVSEARVEDYESIFRFLYQNLDIWAKGDDEKELKSLIIIRDGIYKHGLIADPEINLSATLAELQLLQQG